MRYAVLFGVVLAFAGLAYLGVVSGGRFLVHPAAGSRLAGREPLVGCRHGRSRSGRRRAPASVPPSDQAGRNGPGAEGPARRAVHRAPGGRGLGGVAGGRREPGAGGGTGACGRRPRNLGVGATGPRRRRAPNQHAQRHLGVVAVSSRLRFSRRFSCSRSHVPRRPESWTHWLPRCCLRRSRLRSSFRSRGRRSSGSTHCRPSSTRTGSCLRLCHSASSPQRSR